MWELKLEREPCCLRYAWRSVMWQISSCMAKVGRGSEEGNPEYQKGTLELWSIPERKGQKKK